MRFQGTALEKWIFRMPDAQRYAAAANCMSVPILVAIFRYLLPCVNWNHDYVDHCSASSDTTHVGLPAATALVSNSCGEDASNTGVTAGVDGGVSNASCGDATWKTLGALGPRLCAHDCFCDLHSALLAPQRGTGRQRELFPLLLIPGEVVVDSVGGSITTLAHAQSYLDAVIVWLNWLHGVRSDQVMCSKITAAQRESHGVVVEAAVALHERLQTSIDKRGNEGWTPVEEAGATPPLSYCGRCLDSYPCRDV